MADESVQQLVQELVVWFRRRLFQATTNLMADESVRQLAGELVGELEYQSLWMLLKEFLLILMQAAFLSTILVLLQ